MKTIIKFSIFTVLAVTSVFAILNWDSFKVFADTGKRMIENKINEAQSMETKLSLLQTRITGLDKEIYDLKTEVIRRKVDVEYMGKIVSDKESALFELKDALKQASTLLEDHRDSYVIGRRKYTFEEVARDAEEKLKLCRIQEETLKNLKRTLDTKLKTLALAEENVIKGEGMKGELTAKLKFLKAQVERFKAKEVYAETIKVEDPTSQEFKTLIGKTQKMLAEFEKQLAVKDRLLDERIRLSGDYVGGIDYSDKGETDSDDIAGEIEGYFRKGSSDEMVIMDK
jgi:hypothetical protein